MKISELGERGLLQLIAPYCRPDSIGDDGAMLSVPAGAKLVVTTDVLVDGVHFSDRTMTALDTGWRAIAVNLSDLAAMGAKPLGITVGLSLPPDLAVAWVSDLYRGMGECVDRYDTGIVGGDITRSPTITIGITALGWVDPADAICRGGARDGDAIVITGYHGRSAIGLELLLNPTGTHSLSPAERQQAIASHRRPLPRFDVIDILTRSKGNHRVAGMDSSDGLADAIIQICRASNVGAKIDRARIPICPIVAKYTPERAFDRTLYGGEDFELVMTMPPDLATVIVDRSGNGAAIIGTITTDKSIEVINPDRSIISLDMRSGFQHFS
jgi:thiamine-monophosphate kinase